MSVPKNTIHAFEPIRLEEMDQVKLMNRIDTKYWFHIKRLNDLLERIKAEYYILHIDENCVQLYTTTYYDTFESDMFIQHHNGKLSRYKVRRRNYILSGISFLEVKFKNNKRKTIKKRIPAEYGNTAFSDKEKKFLSGLIPYDSTCLYTTVGNEFRRITLVNKNFKERCTIDFELSFKTDNKNIELNDLVIMEIKTDGRWSASPLALALRDARLKNSGFSKYCIGCAVTNPKLKRNNFKRKIRRIEKIIQTTNNLYNIN